MSNPVHIIGFLSQWKIYLDELPQGPDAKNFAGKKLDQQVYEKAGTISINVAFKSDAEWIPDVE